MDKTKLRWKFPESEFDLGVYQTNLKDFSEPLVMIMSWQEDLSLQYSCLFGLGKKFFQSIDAGTNAGHKRFHELENTSIKPIFVPFDPFGCWLLLTGETWQTPKVLLDVTMTSLRHRHQTKEVGSFGGRVIGWWRQRLGHFVITSETICSCWWWQYNSRPTNCSVTQQDDASTSDVLH